MRNPFPRPLSKLESKDKLRKYLEKLISNDLPTLNEDILPDDIITKYNVFKDELNNFWCKTMTECNKLKNEKQ